MQFIDKLGEGDSIQSVYYIKVKSSATAKTGKEYYNVQLQDKTGMLDGKIWDTSSIGIEEFKAGDFVYVEADIISYNGQLQARITRTKLADKSDYNTEDYFPTSKRDKKVMEKELDAFISEVKNKNFSKLLNVIFVEDKIFRGKFISHQGAKVVHHSFVSGLLEHTLSTTRLAKKIAESYDDINLDLVITACLLHDIAKISEIDAFPTNEYSDEGQLLGHIILAYGIVLKKIDEIGTFTEKEKNELLHCIIAHHGSTDFGSPKLPMLMEAYVVAQADNTDAKLEIMRENIANAKASGKSDANGFVGTNKFYGSNFRESKIN